MSIPLTSLSFPGFPLEARGFLYVGICALLLQYTPGGIVGSVGVVGADNLSLNGGKRSNMRVVVVGGVAGSMSAEARLRRRDEGAEIIG